MNIVAQLKTAITSLLKNAYDLSWPEDAITVNETAEGFAGDYTVVLFPLLKPLRANPMTLGKQLGEGLKETLPEMVDEFEVVKGFLNVRIHNSFLLQGLAATHPRNTVKTGARVMVEYASPNTNKPLHLGHLRNIFLGWSVAEIMKANGNTVMKTCVVNDRGVHICKSMLAWQLFGNGDTPASTSAKGDHFVGDYYVKFENALRNEARPIFESLQQSGAYQGLDNETSTKAWQLFQKLQESDLPAETREEISNALNDIARNNTTLMQRVRHMLVKWEEGDEETLKLWRTMNGWVYEGFNATYKRIGADFDKTYYESDTYLLGKTDVAVGLRRNVFFQKDDGSIWVDLTDEGLDEKLLLRRDGTSVYITQDIGLARIKYEDFPMEQSVYVVGDEQNYHFEVLKLICKRLEMPFADGIYHLSYGMVDLPSGRMKSREGTVVDADDLCDEMLAVAEAKTKELGKVADFTAEELSALYQTLAMGALKFYLLRVDPKKRMVFNPEESIDFHGFTGPFVQYSYARIQSVLRKAQSDTIFTAEPAAYVLQPAERTLALLLLQYELIIQQAAREHNPSVIASYAFQLAKQFNSFYAAHSILQAETAEAKAQRLALASKTGDAIKHSLTLLGISVPDRM